MLKEPVPPSRAAAADEDARDPLASFRDRFLLPEGTLYFDGNSLGPLARTTREHLREAIEDQWAEDLIGSWNRHGWIDLPRRLGARVAPLIGAAEDQVVVCDSVSVNLFKLLAVALELRPERRTILCQADHFPTDLYMAQGLTRLLGEGYSVRYASVEEIAATTPEEGRDVAVVSLGHVDFRTGRLHPMGPLTEAVRRIGALSLWDLSHSVGALPVELDAHGVDLAVGCTYKFLNGGPGAPAFLYVARRLLADAVSPLPGWLGHRDPFAFAREYVPAAGIERFVCGTPPVLAMASLEGALKIFESVNLKQLRHKSIRLGELFRRRVAERCPGIEPLGPADPDERGSQVSFVHPDGYAVIQALIDAGVVGDFRAPDILRFGLCPLYLRYTDAWDAVEILRRLLVQGTYRDERFARRSKVT